MASLDYMVKVGGIVYQLLWLINGMLIAIYKKTGRKFSLKGSCICKLYVHKLKMNMENLGAQSLTWTL